MTSYLTYPPPAIHQVYSVEGSPLCLTGTAEVPLGGVYMDKLLQEAELPIKMAAYGHCFRTEAGAAGAAGKGLYRVHQFSKVRLTLLEQPQTSIAHSRAVDFHTACCTACMRGQCISTA